VAMRVLIVTYRGPLGGAERLLRSFATGLGPDVAVGCPSGPLADLLRSEGFDVREIPLRSPEVRARGRDRLLAPARLAAHALDIRALVRRVRPDVLIAWGMRSAIAAPLAVVGLRSRPAIVFQHNDLLPGPHVARLVRTVSRRADAVSALSQAIARDLDPDGRLGARLHVVRPGVDLDHFRPAGPPMHRPRAVLIGSIVDWKRPDLALEIVALAARRLPELELVVVGGTIDGPGERLLGWLRGRASEPDLAGRVDFRGWLPDAGEALADASCLLHCADREPLGMVIVEALACGRPVVAPAAGGPCELVDDKVGRLYPPGDAAAGAAALIAVAGDAATAARMGAAARERAEACLDHAAARHSYVAMLAEVAVQSPSASRSFRSPR
jgi:glycosyltransferase involved in cell wall biosynthesis